MAEERVNVLCAKWGTKYPAYYVNRLYAGVAKWLARPFRFVCATNESEGIRPEVECVALDPNPHVKNRNWPNIHAKLTFFRRPPIGNSSCFRFDAGTDAAHGVYESFLRDKEDPSLDWYFRKGSQKFQTRAMFERGNVSWWPEEWVCSFKRQCVPLWPFNRFLVPRRPKGPSVIAFHGNPDIPEAIDGFFTHKGEKIPMHLTCLPTPWVKELWENP